MVHQYAKYQPKDFDSYDCLKLSKGIYLILLFVLRGYVVWLISLANMSDRTSFIALVFPEPNTFYLSLLSGLLGIFIVIVISFRRPNAATWVKQSWQKLRALLLSALVFDLIVNVFAYFYWQLDFQLWLMVNVVTVIAFTIYLYNNQRLILNINEFPEKLPEK